MKKNKKNYCTQINYIIAFMLIQTKTNLVNQKDTIQNIYRLWSLFKFLIRYEKGI